mmetsp:Transcript_25950/g.47061  ORF Transcript_25950/g.47061 Transcript_25950/m.47061 type:complete len:94 (-) Transcript_25950:48-329(-)
MEAMAMDFAALKENAAVSMDGVASLLIIVGVVILLPRRQLRRMVAGHAVAEIVAMVSVATKEIVAATTDGVVLLMHIAFSLSMRYNICVFMKG